MVKVTRPHLVQVMLDGIKKQGDYYEDYPKHWMDPEHGMQYALVKYVEDLEKELALTKKKLKKAVKVNNDKG